MGIRKACDECGKTFISNIVLNKHKKHVHRKEGAYPCKFCGRVFKYNKEKAQQSHVCNVENLALLVGLPDTCQIDPFCADFHLSCVICPTSPIKGGVISIYKSLCCRFSTFYGVHRHFSHKFTHSCREGRFRTF